MYLTYGKEKDLLVYTNESIETRINDKNLIYWKTKPLCINTQKNKENETIIIVYRNVIVLPEIVGGNDIEND